MKEMRIGHGYDVHRLVPERKLIIGGVELPHNLGLLGHSDADVLLHAVIDAIIGALGLGDIGKHFPDTKDEFKGISSMHLLARVKRLLDENNGKIINIDVTLIIQRPKVALFIDKMKKNIAFCLNCDEKRVNVKATTEEKLGFTGREEGISAHAVTLIEIDI